MRGAARHVRATWLAPLFLVLAACEQPTALEPPDVGDAQLAKVKGSGGGRVPLQVTFASADGNFGVFGDGRGVVADGAEANLQAYIGGGGRDVYIVTYYTSRTLRFEFPAAIHAAATWEAGSSFNAPSHLLLAGGSLRFADMPIFGGDPFDPEQWIWWETHAEYPHAELQFYPDGFAQETYELAYSSVAVVRTGADDWWVIPNPSTPDFPDSVKLSEVRRKGQGRKLLWQGVPQDMPLTAFKITRTGS